MRTGSGWLLLLALLLPGCANLPASAPFTFTCGPNGELIAIVVVNESNGYAAEVGRCLGELKIIGRGKGTGT